MSAPAGPGDRLPFPDALRGLAILGILPVNAAFFAYPSTLAAVPGYPEEGGAAGAAAVHLVRFLFESKFHAIFAVLFGAGMVLQRRRALAAGRSWGPVAARRLGVLLAIGGLHGAFLWYGDILAVYALLGFGLLWAPARSPGALRIVGLVLLALPAALYAAALPLLSGGSGWVANVVAEAVAPPLPDGVVPGWVPGTWDGFAEGLSTFDPDFEIAVYREGGFLQATALRSVTWAVSMAVAIPLWVPRLGGLFLLGMAFASEGWFTDPSSAEGRRRFGAWLRWGLAAGLPLTAVAVALPASLPDDPAAAVGGELAQHLGSLGLAAAFAALAARACDGGPGARLLPALRAVGRMALTNYLLQTAVMTTLFYGATAFLGAGLGGFASVGRWPLLGIAAAVAAAEAAGSVLWLRRFRSGPVEALWKAAAWWGRPGRGR